MEKVSKMPFDIYLKKHIFDLAGMNDTYLGTQAGFQKTNVTKRYLYPKHYYPNLQQIDSLPEIINTDTNYTTFWGQGDVISTTSDLFKFDQALYNNKLLNNDMLDEAFKPMILNNKKEVVAGGGVSYGLGWYILKIKPHEKIVFHTGYILGIRTVFFRNLSKKQTVIILDNAESKANFITASNAISILDNTSQEKVKISIADRYAKVLFKSGPDIAASRLIQMQGDTSNYIYAANEMDYIGNELLNAGFTDKALEAFKINLLLNPSLPVIYNSYGNALIKANKKPEAILIYKRAIKLKPDDKEAKEALEKLESDSTNN